MVTKVYRKTRHYRIAGALTPRNIRRLSYGITPARFLQWLLLHVNVAFLGVSMNQHHIGERIKNLCYQCQFKTVIDEVEQYCREPIDTHIHFDLKLYQSQALFEMHRVNEAKSLLHSLSQSEDKHSERYLYVMAKLYYADKDWEKASRIFALLMDQSETIKDYFKAVLGLANVYMSTHQIDKLAQLMSELHELADSVNLDQKLSFLLLKGNYLCQKDKAMEEGSKLLYDVIAKAYPRQWNYFVIKGLYSLAGAHQAAGQMDALLASLHMLRCVINPNESVYLTHLVNEKFKEANFSVSSSLSFDPEHKKIAVQGQWIALHDKPLIYQFLECLHGSSSFVSKEIIAEKLWPHDEYTPKTHDPRIFDIARRVRALIEPYENQPVSLLSGRLGYKLACESEPSRSNDRRYQNEVLRSGSDNFMTPMSATTMSSSQFGNTAQVNNHSY